jgi:hypothetical protein
MSRPLTESSAFMLLVYVEEIICLFIIRINNKQNILQSFLPSSRFSQVFGLKYLRRSKVACLTSRNRNSFNKTCLQWKSNKYYIVSVCVCSLSYLACRAHALYYIVICGLSGCTILFTLSHKWYDFRKNVI